MEMIEPARVIQAAQIGVDEAEQAAITSLVQIVKDSGRFANSNTADRITAASTLLAYANQRRVDEHYRQAQFAALSKSE